jgi:CubicO group peptidase (beta-lactamase class C family)
MDIARISPLLTRIAQASAVPGGQFAVFHEGRTLTTEFGEEQRGNGRPVTAESKIPIGSISKTFTATLAMVLVSDGDLDLDTPVGEYLPEVRQVARELGGRLTLRHLLSHTGGLPSDQEHGQTASLRRHVLDCFRHAHPLDRPGRTFSYSNIGYVIAGHLIEAVTGMSWWEAMELVLLKPLELTATFVVGPGPRRPMATGHSVNAARGRVRPVRQSLSTVDAPAGALAASASDLLTLGRFLSGAEPRTLIDPGLLEEMRVPVAGAEPFGMADGWGLGLAVYRAGGTTWVGHDGTADGTSCHLRVDPVSGTVVALTTNGSTGFPMWHRLVGELTELGLPVGDHRGLDGRNANPAPFSEYPECVGTYRNGDLEYSVQAGGPNRLELTVDGELSGELTVYDGLVFTVRDADTGEADLTGRFLRDSSRGEIEWVQIGGRLARRHDRAREVA